MPIYMKYGKINGPVTGKYKGWIELTSCQFGVGRGISTPVGTSSKRESSAPNISEIVVTKAMDITSPLLFQEALTGEGTKVSSSSSRSPINCKPSIYKSNWKMPWFLVTACLQGATGHRNRFPSIPRKLCIRSPWQRLLRPRLQVRKLPRPGKYGESPSDPTAI